MVYRSMEVLVRRIVVYVGCIAVFVTHSANAVDPHSVRLLLHKLAEVELVLEFSFVLVVEVHVDCRVVVVLQVYHADVCR
jgi:hypothetical protein